VGGMLDAHFTIKHVELDPEDLLFAHTDGLTDAINASGELSQPEEPDFIIDQIKEVNHIPYGNSKFHQVIYLR
jgi:serine phosphatase RsbU (regulator of sigma subunit)